MGAQCCRRRADDDDDDHDEVASPCLADADNADADGHADDDDHDEVGPCSADADGHADDDDDDEVGPCSPLSSPSPPSSPPWLPAPSWGRSFMSGQELRRRAGVDSQSMELPPQQ